MPSESVPSEPLGLLETLAGPPDAADYDAVHAVLMATERGRRFLAEYAARNRHADTAMLVEALGRVEGAIRGDVAPPAPVAASAGNLVEIAAALDRIETAIAAGAAPAPLAAAVERLQDIAFMLHEQPLEAAPRDALDAAVREISDATMRTDPMAERLRQATELLRALASRVSEMVAQAAKAPNADQSVGGDAAEPGRDAHMFEAPPANSETFAQTVAALAAATPTLADTPEQGTGEGAEIQATDTAPTNVVALVAATEAIVADPETPKAESAPPQQTPTDVSLSVAVLSEAFSDDHFSSTDVPSENIANEETLSETLPTEEPSNNAAPPAKKFLMEPIAGPEQDPGNLFEPQSVLSRAESAAAEAAAPMPPDNPTSSDLQPEPQRTPPPPALAEARPAGSDPLADVRSLSAEELIALFS